MGKEITVDGVVYVPKVEEEITFVEEDTDWRAGNPVYERNKKLDSLGVEGWRACNGKDHCIAKAKKCPSCKKKTNFFYRKCHRCGYKEPCTCDLSTAHKSGQCMYCAGWIETGQEMNNE